MQLRLRSPRPSLYDRADAVRCLVALLRAGHTMTGALETWHLECPSADASIRRVSRLVALGCAPPSAVGAAQAAMGEDIAGLKAVIDLHSEVGADPIPMLERVAMTIARRADSESAGRAASAGAKLSGAIVGALPLISLPLLPMAHAPLFDGAGLALLFFGLLLTCAGMWWMWRLVPAAETGDDPLALLADQVASALAAGASLFAALDAATRRAPGNALASAGRRARLGQPWPEALMAVAPEGSQALIAALRRSEGLGVPPARTLAAFAEARRAVAARAFERRVRRAPVLMVLPLVLCVLPAFGLLAVLPFLRGITLG